MDLLLTRAAALVVALGTAGCNAIFGISEGAPGDAGSGDAGDAGLTYGMVDLASAGQPFSFMLGGTLATASLTRSFAIDRHEVTVERFRAWVKAGRAVPCAGCSLDPGGPYATRMTWNASWSVRAKDGASYTIDADCSCPKPYHPTTYNRTDGRLPMTCVTWYQAAAFCASEGKRLPTETEWEYAATGRGDGRTYPFEGTSVDCEHATIDGCGFPVPVGTASRGASLDGVLDLAGSVFEWVWDAEGAYPGSATSDYSGPSTSGPQDARHVRHGGAFISEAADPVLTNEARETFFGADFFSDAGFRCAKTLP